MALLITVEQQFTDVTKGQKLSSASQLQHIRFNLDDRHQLMQY
jgi:hypothetical protein